MRHPHLQPFVLQCQIQGGLICPTPERGFAKVRVPQRSNSSSVADSEDESFSASDNSPSNFEFGLPSVPPRSHELLERTIADEMWNFDHQAGKDLSRSSSHGNLQVNGRRDDFDCPPLGWADEEDQGLIDLSKLSPDPASRARHAEDNGRSRKSPARSNRLRSSSPKNSTPTPDKAVAAVRTKVDMARKSATPPAVVLRYPVSSSLETAWTECTVFRICLRLNCVFCAFRVSPKCVAAVCCYSFVNCCLSLIFNSDLSIFCGYSCLLMTLRQS